MNTATKWGKIAHDLRAQITDGTLVPGDRLPTEADLALQWGVARATVRQALLALGNEGVITSRAPLGWFVRDRNPMTYMPQDEGINSHQPTPELDEFMAKHSADGRNPSQTIEVSIVEPPPIVAERLRLEPGASVVVRRRVRLLDGEPFHSNDSYYPLDLVKDSDVLSPRDIPRGASRILGDLGYPQTRALDEFYVRMPRPDEAERLRLSPGTPIACHVVTGYTDDDKPVRVVVNILPGDRHVIVYQREVDLGER